MLQKNRPQRKTLRFEKPHLYKVKGLWYCRVIDFNYSMLGPGRLTIKGAYVVFRELHMDLRLPKIRT